MPAVPLRLPGATLRLMRAWLAMVVLLLAGQASAGELRALVTDQRGKPVADAVVSVHPVAGASVPSPPPPRTRTINQVALAFVPYIEVFRPGDKVVFNNG